MKQLQFPKIKSIHLYWISFITFLLVLLPQEAWAIGQGQDTTTQWKFLGVSASPLGWMFASVLASMIAIITNRLTTYWGEMPKYRVPTAPADDAPADQHKQYAAKVRSYNRKVFNYRWVNIYAGALILAMVISAVANLMHVVQFMREDLKIFALYPWGMAVYQVLFGLALPGVSFVFARVLSTIQETEQQEDPAFAKAKEELKEANATIRKLNETIRQTEQTVRETEKHYSGLLKNAEHLLNESEQRYKAVGDVIRWLFGKDENLRDRIRGIRKAFPSLSQNGIAQIVGCSVSTVNEALQGYQVELPELVEVQS